MIKRLSGYFITGVLLLVFLLLPACSNPSTGGGGVTVKSSVKEFISFTFSDADNAALNSDAFGAINETAGTVDFIVPAGTDITGLVASYGYAGDYITVEDSVQQSGVTANDFTGPVNYTVVAEDGSTKSYVVTVTVATPGASDAKDITSFGFPASSNAVLSFDVTGVITGTAVALEVPYGTAVTALIPEIEVSAEALVSPNNGADQDFTSLVSYTVTAQDGSTQEYSVTVTVAQNDENDIVSFVFIASSNAVLSSDVTGVITGTAIALEVPYGTAVTSLTADIEVSAEAGVSPAGGTSTDFTSPVSYTVTAENGDTQIYTVTVTAAMNSENVILSFSFPADENAVLDEDVDGSVNNGTGAIQLLVPDGTPLTSLIPDIEVSADASVSPNDGVAQNFTGPVVYTVTAQDGTTRNYSVTVNVSGPSDGSITVQLTDAAADNGKMCFFAILPGGMEYNPDEVLAVNGGLISGGQYTDVAEDIDTGVVYTFTGGESYEVYLLVDRDGDGEPTTGDLTGNTQVIVNGDSVAGISWNDLVEIQAEDGTITVSLSGAAAYSGDTCGFAVYEGEESTFDYENPGTLHGYSGGTIVGGAFSDPARTDPQNGDFTEVVFTGGTSYVITFMIDSNGNGVPDIGEMVVIGEIQIDGDGEVVFDITDLSPLE